MRRLYHAINGSGVGHLMRVGAIATQAERMNHNLHQTIATEAPIVNFLKELNVAFIILPHSDRRPFASLNRRRVSWTRRTNVRLLYRVIEECDPDVSVFDTHFSTTLIKRLASEGRTLALILREIRSDYLKKLLDDGVLERFQAIIVPHRSEDFHNGLNRTVSAQFSRLSMVEYVGEIVREIDPSVPSETPKPFILITAGAGGYGDHFSKMLASVVPALSRVRCSRPRLNVIIAAGLHKEIPEMEDVVVLPWAPRLPSLMSHADLVIGHAGYNTLHEVLQAGARGLFYAAPRLHENQKLRLATWGKRAGIETFELDEGERTIANRIEKVLRMPRPDPVRFDGAKRAAQLLAGLSAAEEARKISWASLAEGIPVARKLTVDLEHGTVQEIIGRAKVVIDIFGRKDGSLSQLTLTFLDEQDGLTAAEVTKSLASYKFRALIARLRNPHPASTARHFEAWRIIDSIPTCFCVDLVPEEDFSFNLSMP